MLKIKISETFKEELKKLDFDVEEILSKIIKYIPQIDLIGLDYILVTDKPHQWKKHLSEARGSYSQKHNNTSAYIEIYLSRILAQIKSAEQLKLIMPIFNVSLAETVLHEVGHHVERNRSHGITKNKREKFAYNYSINLLSKYEIDNADFINSCLENLEKRGDELGLSQDRIEQMRKDWEKCFKDINKRY